MPIIPLKNNNKYGDIKFNIFVSIISKKPLTTNPNKYSEKTIKISLIPNLFVFSSLINKQIPLITIIIKDKI